MSARKGCWTIPQLLLELESKVKALEADNTLLNASVRTLTETVTQQADRIEDLENAHYYVYQHVLTCGGTYDNHSEVFYLALVTASNEAFTSATLTEYLLANGNATYNAVGYTHDDIAIVGLEVFQNEFLLKLPDSSGYDIPNVTVSNDSITTIQVK